MKKIKICLTSSAGGHIKELQQLEPLYLKYNHYFVTANKINTQHLIKKEKVYFIINPSRNPIKLIINFFQSLKIFLIEKPDLIISTGADTSLTTIYIGKLFRKKIIYVESFCRIKKPSLTGKLVYPTADLFIYQWKYLDKYYPKGKYGGNIFKVIKMIFVSVGTFKTGFDRLIKEIDELKEKKLIKEEVTAQIGHGKYIPKNIKFERFFDEEKMEEHIKKCTTYIIHGGVGSISSGLILKKKILILPRLKKFKEAVDDHQKEIAIELEKTGQAIYCKNEKDIIKKINEKNKINKIQKKGFTIKLIEEFIQEKFN